MSASILQGVVQYSFYSGCILFVCGIVGNALNILTFTQLKMFRDNRCAFYLIIESVSNVLYMCHFFSLTVLTAIFGDDASGSSSMWCKLKFISVQTFVLTTFTMICLAAIDQYCSTNYLFYIRQSCSMKLARCLTCAFICIWTIHSVVFATSFDAVPLVGCIIPNPVALQYSTYFVYPILLGFLPVMIAAIYGILAFRNVRRIVRRQIPIIRRRLDQEMTAIVLSRVMIFLITITPYDFFRIYILNFPASRAKPMEYAVGRVLSAFFLSLATLNYSIGFYVFLMISSSFRRQVKVVLVKKIWQQCKSCCLPQHNRVAPESQEQGVANSESEQIF